MNIQELEASSEEAAALLLLLANPHRLQILCRLLEGEQSVTLLAGSVGLSQSALSQHLAKLRAGGVVATRRSAQMIYYSIADPRTAQVLDALSDIFCKPGGGAVRTASSSLSARKRRSSSVPR